MATLMVGWLMEAHGLVQDESDISGDRERSATEDSDIKAVSYTRILLALLCLLALATSASAECAWVLWQYPYDPSKRQAVDSPEVVAGAVPVGAYGDEPTCKSVTASENKTHASRLLDPAIKGVRPWYTLCLPDTIDPRGPKGK